jgi:hypothetical protein
MGEGGHRLVREAARVAAPGPSPRSHLVGGLAGLRGSPSLGEHKARAGLRAALPVPATTLPQPGGADGACARRRQARRRPAPRGALGHRAPARAAPAPAFVVRPNSADPRLPAEKFCAPPLSGPEPAPLARSPASAARRGSDARARHPRPRGVPDAPAVPEGRWPWSHLSSRPAPPKGSARPGTHAPPPQHPSEPWGRGQPPCAVPRPRTSLGRVPTPRPSRSRERSAGPGGNQAPHPQPRRPVLLAAGHSPASCLRSSSADCSSVILPAKGPGCRRGFRRAADKL